jgi:hypothetical protein
LQFIQIIHSVSASTSLPEVPTAPNFIDVLFRLDHRRDQVHQFAYRLDKRSDYLSDLAYQ